MGRWASTRMRAALAATALAASLGGLAACRGDTGAPLSQWIAKADEICKQVQDEADQTRPVLFEQSLAQTLRKSADYSNTEAQRLRGLDKPGEQRDKVREYLASLDERNRELERIASEAEHPGPDFKPPSLDSLAAGTQKAADQAKALGLKQCRSGIDVSIGGAEATTTTAPQGAPPGPPDTGVETEDKLG